FGRLSTAKDSGFNSRVASPGDSQGAPRQLPGPRQRWLAESNSTRQLPAGTIALIEVTSPPQLNAMTTASDSLQRRTISILFGDSALTSVFRLLSTRRAERCCRKLISSW